jgi:hypothetical protein
MRRSSGEDCHHPRKRVMTYYGDADDQNEVERNKAERDDG